jgi:hypothetical protein
LIGILDQIWPDVRHVVENGPQDQFSRRSLEGS